RHRRGPDAVARRRRRDGRWLRGDGRRRRTRGRSRVVSRAVSTALHQLIAATEAHRGELGPWMGVEHEFRVVDRRGVVDFRRLVGTLEVGAGDLDPGDARARRLDSGALLTADGREAEIATPPVELRGGFSDALVDLAE